MRDSEHSRQTQEAIVVGGGLSGLSAAYRLMQDGWKVKVIENSGNVGGRANTDSKNGYLIDTGASVMATSYNAYFELIDDLGMSERMIKTSPVIGIPRGNKVHEINLDRMLTSGATTKALSFGAKLRLSRLALTVLRAKSKGQLDYTDLSKGAPLDTESIREYAVRELGQEVNDYLCEPLGRIMVICDGDELTKVELLSGVANIFGTELKTLAGGVNAISSRLAQGMDVHLHSKATQVMEFGEHVQVSWQDLDGNTVTETADACVVTCQLHDALDICPNYESLLKPLSEQIDYTSAITCAVGTSIRPDTDAFLIPVPPCENRDLALIFMDHNKCPDRAPHGKYLINTHWENRASARNLNTSDDVIAEQTIEQLCRYFPEIRTGIEMTHVARWPAALPLTAPGAYKAIAKFNQGLSKTSRVQFAADYMSAAGQNTAVLYGKKAAENITSSHQEASACTHW